ncbi:MFS transporter [Pseudobdellovibrio sp. HCB154]|uniref:MFS transporter n=1 Tax=Pseudobdellovibrio sp. HCB154 TaxID=3386277 RepID=UPI003916EC1D
MNSKNDVTFTGYQKFVVALLAFLQFTIILDFMIMAPLGALMMPALKMDPSQFGVVVSAYAFSAGISGILASGFADRFDRKKFLLFFYVGFIIGTFLCAIAPSFHFMVLARIVTGLFGGVVGSVVLAIAADVFDLSLRGRVMGYIQTAFAASQILGLPAGLYISNLWGWHAPFFMIVAISALVGVIIVVYLKPIDAHVKAARVDHNALNHMLTTVSNTKYLFAFAATALMSIGGFMLMPFGTDFTVQNLKLTMGDLPLIYLVTGVATIFIGPLVGKMSDSFGKLRTFIFGAILSAVMVVYYTNMGPSSLITVMIVNTVMFVGIFSRMIPSQALMSALPTPADRGAFMAVSSSLQSISGGIAAVIAGYIVVKRPDGFLEHFDILGYVLVGTVTVTVFMMKFINDKYIRHDPSVMKKN